MAETPEEKLRRIQAVRDRVARERKAQGLPRYITDEKVLREVAAIIRRAR